LETQRRPPPKKKKPLWQGGRGGNTVEPPKKKKEETKEKKKSHASTGASGVEGEKKIKKKTSLGSRTCGKGKKGGTEEASPCGVSKS